MKQSFLINDRIYLRAVEPEDMDVMYEMENDPSMWDISNFTLRITTVDQRFSMRCFCRQAATSDDREKIRSLHTWYD